MLDRIARAVGFFESGLFWIEYMIWAPGQGVVANVLMVLVQEKEIPLCFPCALWELREAGINTYDHTHWKTRDPVRSPIDKPVRARLVVGSVTTSESLVLYVFFSFHYFFCPPFFTWNTPYHVSDLPHTPLLSSVEVAFSS